MTRAAKMDGKDLVRQRCGGKRVRSGVRAWWEAGLRVGGLTSSNSKHSTAWTARVMSSRCWCAGRMEGQLEPVSLKYLHPGSAQSWLRRLPAR